jgi:hypothetical protein
MFAVWSCSVLIDSSRAPAWIEPSRDSADRDLLACARRFARLHSLSKMRAGSISRGAMCEQIQAMRGRPTLRQNVVRYCRCKIGDLRRFYATPWIPYSSDVDRRNVFASVYHRCVQGIAEVQQLLAAAERYCTEALRMAEQHGNPNSIAAALPASRPDPLRTGSSGRSRGYARRSAPVDQCEHDARVRIERLFRDGPRCCISEEF